MNFYEYSSHEYSYGLYLAYIYDLSPYDSMILNMVSKRYPREEDEDCDSASDFENCAEDGSDDEEEEEVICVSPHNMESSTSQNSILFSSFESPIIMVATSSIAPVFYGFSIKIGEISCFFGDACNNDGVFTIDASEEETKDVETQFVIFEGSEIPANMVGNMSGRPTGAYGLAYDRPEQAFFLNREGLGFFRSLFSLKGQATDHSKSLLSLLGWPV